MNEKFFKKFQSDKFYFGKDLEKMKKYTEDFSRFRKWKFGKYHSVYISF